MKDKKKYTDRLSSTRSELTENNGRKVTHSSNARAK